MATFNDLGINSFQKLANLKQLRLDSNPISSIQPGASNGLSSLLDLGLNSLNMAEFDLLASYVLTSLIVFHINNSPLLTTIQLSDYQKIPDNIEKFDFSFNNLTTVSSNVQYWLSASAGNELDILNNLQYICNPSIQWMAKFAACIPIQIETSGTVCAQTKQPLIYYLRTFNPC